eukprot:CAMPEP_0174261660 /NCGR_PEP_ID=MMETSP0439-20130205/11739_1 /TAXON_ID=0 /ORGANISM="Stereomyxa ramosa, Strain Chinc5" /LENGTH=352 /DNA_ID=CAMNT_0015346173 /DNA_START=26 /DNA_END=1081 /DNA_ORIENTATION=-
MSSSSGSSSSSPTNYKRKQMITAIPITEFFDEELEETKSLLPQLDVTHSYSTKRRLLLVIIATLASFLLSGVIFGWAPLLITLQKEGIYEFLCEPHEELPCDAQNTRLNLIFVVASTSFSCCVLPLGYFMDVFGPRVSMFLGSLLYLTGSILFALSSNTFDAFIPAFALLGIGGPPIVFSFIHLSNLFPRKAGTIITLLNVALDASSLIFLLFQVATDNSSKSRLWFFAVYAVIPVLLILSFPIWPAKPCTRPAEPEESSTSGSGDEKKEKPKADSEVTTIFAHLPFLKQLIKLEFLFGLVYTSIQLLRINFYIATVELQLSDIVEDSQLWTQLFSVILPIGGVLSVPIIGW